MKKETSERQQPTAREKTLWTLVLTLTAALLVGAALLLITLFGSKPAAPEPVQRTDYTADENTDWSAVVLTDADGWGQLTAGELNYYFWSEYFYLINAANQAGIAYFDPEQPLNEQLYSNDVTWQQYILEQALDSARQTAALVRAGEAAGFVMDAEYQASLDEQLASFESYAVANGFTNEDGSGNLLAYLQDSYGEGASAESFAAYLRRSYYASAYSDELYAHTEVEQTKLAAYFDAYADEYEQAYGVTRQNSPRLVNLRCIYFIVSDTQSDAAWAQTKQAAERVQALWLENPTEEAFAALADEYTQAPGASAGGLYEEVYPGGMEDALDDWLFADGRQPGDFALLQDDNGWILALHSSYSKLSYWQYLARNDMISESYSAALYQLVADNDFLVYEQAIAIAVPAKLGQDS